jgi:predicted amidophosphoribosyltransferase
MARPLAGGLGLPLLPRLLIRSLPTRRQTGLRREERKADLSASFAASAEARGRRILLVDDAMTTGTTLRHAVLCLLRAGASTVCAAVAARTALR